MDRFRRDELLVIVCFAGVVGLFLQLAFQSLGLPTKDVLTGAFITLATIPFVGAAAERWWSKRGPDDEDPPAPGPLEMDESQADRITRRSNEQRQQRSDMDLAVAV